MKKIDRIQELEKRIGELEKRNIYPTLHGYPNAISGLDPACLHNGCHHEKNPFCNLYCPHCGPIC